MAEGHGRAASPHLGGTVLRAGPPPAEARAAVILVHGRGADAADILQLARLIEAPDIAYAAPEAAGRSWYPYSFLAPTERNEPGLSSGLAVLQDLVAGFARAGLDASRVALLGFSQGACLSLEFAARNPMRYGAVIGLSGGLIGPAGTTWPAAGSLDGTPIFLGCSDVDPHIPLARVQETADVLTLLGGAVTLRLYEGMGHTINEDEIVRVGSLLRSIG